PLLAPAGISFTRLDVGPTPIDHHPITSYNGVRKTHPMVRQRCVAVTIVKLSAKGQLVIPSEIREKYDLRKGDRFQVREEAGAIVLQPLERHPALELRGAFKGKPSLTEALLRERRADRAREDKELV
ncbi:MAG: AbrB/MazE/SpoVT family DNA-binding domain-containing protein, partial [Bacillota bacterium]|nr:AbrB/MazE/SpoVT family DNA-binding domain-containing protein [Bacillota bacterium]